MHHKIMVCINLMDECIDCSEPQQPPRQATPATPPREGNTTCSTGGGSIPA